MNKEQTLQFRHVIDALALDLYHPLGDIAFSGFRADRSLSLTEAEKAEKRPMPEGTAWGGPRDYAWMFAEIEMPAEAEGERIVMDLHPGGESTVFVNGKPFGTKRAERLEHPHHFIVDQTIAKKAVPGDKVRVVLEVYGGTPQPVHTGRPIFPEKGIELENNGPAVMGRSTFGFWNEEAYQLWLDLTMLRDLYRFLPDGDAMKTAISVHVCRLLDVMDMEKPLPERRKAYEEARALLKPVMEARNGTFAPSMGVVGNSHLDLAWLWPIGETRRKTARTFAAQLRLLEEYPEALFLQSQCAEYELCREHYPELFSEIKAAIGRGQWIADGGMWVEPDTNLSGGEALVRQFLYGRKYYREVLNTDSRVAWLPDTFGYSAALPQILKSFGMEGLTTQKIFWTYNDCEPFPHHAFMWEGMDGTKVPAYLHMFYETKMDAGTLHTRWASRLEDDGSGDFYQPFGYGDGGGGPTRDDMEQIRRQKDLQGSPKLYWMGPKEYLKKRDDGSLPVYRGELYFPCHRGTYTTQAAIKKGNRRCENALRAWEMVAAVAAYTGKAPAPAEELEATWKCLLRNQFHDILPGSSVGDVYELAREEHAQILKTAEEGLRKSLASFVREDDKVLTFWNPGSHETRRLVETDTGLRMVRVPALGCTTLTGEEETKETVTLRKTEDGYLLENGILSARINGRGEVVSMIMNGTERIAAPSNVFHLYRDLPRMFDAWDIDSQTERREVFPERNTEIFVEREEGRKVSLRVVTRISKSVIDQKISLTAGSAELDFETQVDWHECHRLLKVSFDTGIRTLQASHRIQFGYMDRPAHRSRQYDADRFEVCCHTWSAMHDATHGAAVLNDSKYGIGACDGVLSLSLLRAPTYPDPEADRGAHAFTYAYKVWDGAFENAGLEEAAEVLNCPLVPIRGTCDLPTVLCLNDPAVMVESIKPAEDGSGDMILRLFEGMNGTRKVKAVFGVPVDRLRECDMEENVLQELPVAAGEAELSFRPFEIKTLRLSRV